MPRPAPIRRTRLNIIPVMITVLGLGILGWGLLGFVKPPPVKPAGANPPSSTPASVDALKDSVEQLKDRVDTLKDRQTAISAQASQVQGLLSIVLAAAGLFTLLQGIFAFFSAQNYVKQAEDAIKKANDSVTAANGAVTAANDAVAAAKEAANKAVTGANDRMATLAADILARFPMFGDAESARAAAFKRLSDLALGLDLNEENIYASSEPFTRQEIFATESFSAIQFLTGENRNDDLTKHLRLLGRFYGGKVLSDKEKALPSDFERALYYFHLALKKSPRSYAVLNDYGWLFSFVANPKQFELAKSYFRASLEANPAQQRALYNLGTIAMTTRTHLQQGLNDLLGAAQQTKWEESESPTRTAHIHYNIACVCDLLYREITDAAKKKELVEICCYQLEIAAEQGKQSRELLHADLEPAGDLAALAKNEEYAERLSRIMATYERAWTRPPENLQNVNTV